MTRIALVIGGAECAMDDAERAERMFTPHAIYSVNDMAASVRTLDAWCTLHPEHLAGWQALRRKNGLPEEYETVGPLAGEVGMHFKHHVDRRVSYRWPGMNSSGSTGLFAVKVAIEDGLRVVLAGVPMTAAGGHFHRRKRWLDRDSFIPGWEKAMPFLRNYVRSVSGWTMEKLGAPSPEWLMAGDPPRTGTGGLILQGLATGG